MDNRNNNEFQNNAQHNNIPQKRTTGRNSSPVKQNGGQQELRIAKNEQINANRNGNLPSGQPRVPNIKPPKKKKTGKIILTIVAVVLLAIVAVAFYALVIHKPSNEEEDIPFDIDVTQENENENKEPTAPAVDTSAKPGVYNFLVVGKDQVALNTDVMMLINYDTNTQKVNVIQVPRDTFVEYNNSIHKINSMYGVFHEQANGTDKEKEEAGMKGLVDFLEKNMCININYYALVNIQGFRNIVDIIGGVEVDIPADMDYEDKNQNLKIHLKAGKQVLDGENAEGFVRFRSGYLNADYGRMDAQKLFLTAMVKKIKSSLNIDTIAKVANEGIKNLTTDLSALDSVFFAKKFLSVDLSNINFVSMVVKDDKVSDDTHAKYHSQWYVVMVRESALKMINDYLNIYNFEITDSMFDANRVFTTKKLCPYVNDLYMSKGTDANVKIADGIEDVIDLPRY